jgi:glutathione synthase/RimK-type ligase-like ATP-grasp enzyme
VHIAFVTSTAHGDLTPDDHLAVAVLAERGARVTAAIWNDAGIDWGSFDSIIVRSTWDYHKNADQFRAWIDKLDTMGAPLWNPPVMLRWNMEKTYLRELEDAGIPIVPTAWLDRGSQADLGKLLADRGWEHGVVKPVISAAASRTWRVSRDDVSKGNAQLAESLELGDVMVQPFMAEIQTRGEWSLIFIAGEFSHAVRKIPAGGDFRVQHTFGGQSLVDTPSAEVLEVARRVLDAAPSPWLYARVDGIETDAGFVLLELEMLEPGLFLSYSRAGAVRLAEAILKNIRR